MWGCIMHVKPGCDALRSVKLAGSGSFSCGSKSEHHTKRQELAQILTCHFHAILCPPLAAANRHTDTALHFFNTSHQRGMHPSIPPFASRILDVRSDATESSEVLRCVTPALLLG